MFRPLGDGQIDAMQILRDLPETSVVFGAEGSSPMASATRAALIGSPT